MAVIKKYVLKYVNWRNIVQLGVFAGFIVFALLIGVRHEHWVDEAQAWLIARDASYFDIITKYARYEGTPCLWHLILKTLILCGLPYRLFFLVPIFFSSVGVYLLVFKSNLPLFIKILLPFTYYIFYQYTIVARSYCLVLPVLCIIALTYENRFKRPFAFSIELMLLASICLHTVIVSGLIFMLCLYDFIKWARHQNAKGQLSRYFICGGVLSVYYLLMASYAIPPKDISFQATHYLFSVPVSVVYLIVNSMTGYRFSAVFYAIGLEAFAVLLYFMYKNTHRFFNFLFLVVPLILLMAIFYFRPWHIGILFLTIMFACWVFYFNSSQTPFRKNRFLYFTFFIVFTVQIYWTGCSSSYDYSNACSAAYKTAQYIEKNNLDKGKIYGLGYKVIGIEPYFPRNIFSNFNSSRSFYWWSKNNHYLTNVQMIKTLPKAVVVSEYSKREYRDVINALERQGYKHRRFFGYVFIKDRKYETESFSVYVKS